MNNSLQSIQSQGNSPFTNQYLQEMKAKITNLRYNNLPINNDNN